MMKKYEGASRKVTGRGDKLSALGGRGETLLKNFHRETSKDWMRLKNRVDEAGQN